jgi:hypothetical protein
VNKFCINFRNAPGTYGVMFVSLGITLCRKGSYDDAL